MGFRFQGWGVWGRDWSWGVKSLKGYLAHKKEFSSRTLQKDDA